MKNKIKHQSRTATVWDLLPQDEITPLQSFLLENYKSAFSKKHPRISDTDEVELLNSYSPRLCPFCSSLLFIKDGFTRNGVQRYRCKNCKKGFNILTGTLLENHKIPITEFIEYALMLVNFSSTNLAARTNKNGFTTAKYWLEKIFIVLKDYQNSIILSREVFLDETFYSVEKKDLIMVDGKKKRGLSKNQICVGMATDRRQTYGVVVGYGKQSAESICEAYVRHIEYQSLLIHDMDQTHNELIRFLELTDDQYKSTYIKKLRDKDNPLFPINRIHNLFKHFLSEHIGFDRDDFTDYLNLFTFIMNEPHNKLEKVEILLKKLLFTHKTLKYRDFYGKKEEN